MLCSEYVGYICYSAHRQAHEPSVLIGGGVDPTAYQTQKNAPRRALSDRYTACDLLPYAQPNASEGKDKGTIWVRHSVRGCLISLKLSAKLCMVAYWRGLLNTFEKVLALLYWRYVRIGLQLLCPNWLHLTESLLRLL